MLTSTGSVPNWEAASSGAGGATGLSLNDSVNLTLGTGNDATIDFDATNAVFNTTAGSIVVTPNAQLLVNGTASRTVGSLAYKMQLSGSGNADSGLSIQAWASSDETPNLNFMKARGGSPGTYTLVANGDSLGNIIWYGADGNDANTTAAVIQGIVSAAPGADDMPTSLRFKTCPNGANAPTQKFEIHDAGMVSIGSSTAANANMTVGLTIDQGTNDDEIFALKSTGDVDHNFTDITEEATFYRIKKNSSTIGTVQIDVVAEDGNATPVLATQVWGGQASTGKSTGDYGLAAFIIAEHNGSNSQANMAADGNIFSVLCRDNGGNAFTKFIIDEDGDLHVDGSATVGTFDSLPVDAEMCRALDMYRSPNEIIRSEWDDHVKYNYDDLTKAGILGELSEQNRLDGHRPMVNTTQLQRLHNGAIWQTHTDVLGLREVCDYQQEQIESMKAELKLLKG